MQKRDMAFDEFNIVALAGGVGGAKMSHGLQTITNGNKLTVIVNVGDDFEHYGLKICPDLDTVCYTLSDQDNQTTGWGIADESWNVLRSVSILGGPAWFQLGDKDLGTHLERTRRIGLGHPLSRITEDFCKAWGIKCRVLPVTDQWVPTIVHSNEGDLSFQEYFVHRKCTPQVNGFTFKNIAESVPGPDVLESIETASMLLICPSNPFVSIDPILSVPKVRETILKQKLAKKIIVLAVSPIIGGDTVKGPAAKMFREFGKVPTAVEVAKHYKGLIDGFVLDLVDRKLEHQIAELDIETMVTNTIMRNSEDRSRLAGEVVKLGISMFQRQIDIKNLRRN